MPNSSSSGVSRLRARGSTCLPVAPEAGFYRPPGNGPMCPGAGRPFSPAGVQDCNRPDGRIGMQPYQAAQVARWLYVALRHSRGWGIVLRFDRSARQSFTSPDTGDTGMAHAQVPGQRPCGPTVSVRRPTAKCRPDGSRFLLHRKVTGPAAAGPFERDTVKPGFEIPPPPTGDSVGVGVQRAGNLLIRPAIAGTQQNGGTTAKPRTTSVSMQPAEQAPPVIRSQR